MAIRLRLLTVTDLHRSALLYEQLVHAVRQHRPQVVAFVGDFLHGTRDNVGRMREAQCAQVLAALPCREVVFVRGNHEDHMWQTFADAWIQTRRRLNALHGEVFAYEAMTLVGFPCFLGTEDAFIDPRNPLPQDPELWLPEVIKPWGGAGRGIWLMHEPLAGTPLSEPGSPVGGNVEWTQAIQTHQPLLTISGHDHHSPIKNRCWAVRTGNTWSVNAGQTTHGPLHYCVIDAEYRWAQPSTPRFLSITAYPWNETIEITPPAGFEEE